MNNTSVDPEAVKHVADLARVDLETDEIAEFTGQLADILDYFEALDEVPETDSEPDLVNVLRTDEARESLSQEEALQNASATDDDYFKGPPVG